MLCIVVTLLTSQPEMFVANCFVSADGAGVGGKDKDRSEGEKASDRDTEQARGGASGHGRTGVSK